MDHVRYENSGINRTIVKREMKILLGTWML